MLWIREEKYFVSLLITYSKTVQAEFRKKFNNYHQKSQIYRCAQESQATRSVNNHNKKAENPRSARKLTARYPDNVDAVRDSVGSSPKKSLRRHSQEHGFSPAL